MTILEMNASMRQFLDRCYAIIEVKNVDYHPESVPMLGIFRTASETSVSAKQVLWGQMHKQISAVRSYVIAPHGQRVESEPIGQRLADVANYANLIDFLDRNYQTLVANAYDYMRQSTVCEERPWCHPMEPNCERCRLTAWLAAETIRTRE